MSGEQFEAEVDELIQASTAALDAYYDGKMSPAVFHRVAKSLDAFRPARCLHQVEIQNLNTPVQCVLDVDHEGAHKVRW